MASDLSIHCIMHDRRFPRFCQTDIPLPFQKSPGPFAGDLQMVTLGRIEIRDCKAAFKPPLYRSDPYSNGTLKTVRTRFDQLVATRNRVSNSLGIEKCLPYHLPRCLKRVFSFEFQYSSAPFVWLTCVLNDLLTIV